MHRNQRANALCVFAMLAAIMALPFALIAAQVFGNDSHTLKPRFTRGWHAQPRKEPYAGSPPPRKISKQWRKQSQQTNPLL